MQFKQHLHKLISYFMYEEGSLCALLCPFTFPMLSLLVIQSDDALLSFSILPSLVASKDVLYLALSCETLL